MELRPSHPLDGWFSPATDSPSGMVTSSSEGSDPRIFAESTWMMPAGLWHKPPCVLAIEGETCVKDRTG